MSWKESARCTGVLDCCEHAYPDCDGTALAALLGRDGVRLTEVGAPVSTTNRYDRELGDDNSSANGGCDFLRRLDAEPDVAFAISNDDDSLEAGALTSTGLLLHWLDLNRENSSVPFYFASKIARVNSLTFITSSFNFGKKKSTI